MIKGFQLELYRIASNLRTSQLMNIKDIDLLQANNHKEDIKGIKSIRMMIQFTPRCER